MYNSLVSIIIPTYNRAHVIHETLESVLAQTYKNWECIIVDDGSNDNTENLIQEYLKKDQRFRFIKRPKDRKKGGNAARNFGFENSSGDFIQWFDSDDLMHPQLLEKKVEKMKSSQCDYCLCRMAAFYMENNKMITRDNKKINTKNLFLDYLKRAVAIGTPTILWRKSIIDPNNVFDENLLQSQDFEFNSRMLHRNTNSYILDEVLIYYRTNGDSISNNLTTNIELYLDSFLEVRKRIIALEPKNKEIHLAITKEILGLFRACLASKKYILAEQIISFLRKRDNDFFFKLKLEKIFFFYFIFKKTGKGDTKFKSLLKL